MTSPPHAPRTDQPTPDAGRAATVPEPSTNGATPARLAIASIGRLTLSHHGTELTAALTQKPVASYLWLYLLARALRNPKDTIGRGALADESFPNLDSKQQRTRLRQRLSDMQATLPRSVAECVALDGDRVHFDLDACTSDAAELRLWATRVASLRTPMDDAQLTDATALVDRIGDGLFLPGWEALDAKVTGGKGGAISVVDDVRTDIDRWRAALRIAVADSYVARNRPAFAVPYLERVVAQHPDNDVATRKLIAAYLESGDTAKAAALDPALIKARR
jgi:DNA-binding SARP family transcriptional activator